MFNDEVERRGVAVPLNEADLSQSSIPFFASEMRPAIARTENGYHQSANVESHQCPDHQGPLLGPPKTTPADRSNRLLEPLQPVPWALPIMRHRQKFHRNSGIAENYRVRKFLKRQNSDIRLARDAESVWRLAYAAHCSFKVAQILSP